MLRGLTFAVALALGTVTVPAHALGLGDIRARSALNQEFNADIDLLSVAAGELDAVRVSLAEQKEFEKAGVERPFFLTLLKFLPARLEDGSTVIRVSSDFPVREPFLDFLVEVNWPRGRLIREYTVLLDPPVTTRRRAPAISAAGTAVRAPAPATSSTAAVAAAGGEYGPVAQNETLWSIAKKLRPQGGSMHQTMIALLESNPRAFIDGDINRLRKGAILRVPSASEVLSISREQARQAYAEAQERWLARASDRLRDTRADTAPVDTPPSGDQPEAPDTEAELRIATARPEGEGEAGAGEDRGDENVGQLKDKLLLARENAETSRLESETLRTEIEDMQKRLADMQRLLSLKDNQLAQLQAGVATGAEKLPKEPVGAPEVLSEAALDDEMAPPDEPLAETSAAESSVAETPDTLAEDLQAPLPETLPLADELQAVVDPGLEVRAEPVEELQLDTGLDLEQAVQEASPETVAIADDLDETALPDDLIIQPETAVGQSVVEESVADATDAAAQDMALSLPQLSEQAPVETLAESEAEIFEPSESLLSGSPLETDTSPAAAPEAAPQPLQQTPTQGVAALAAEYGLPVNKLRELLRDKGVLYALVGGGVLVLLLLLSLLLRMRSRRRDAVPSVPLAPEEKAVGRDVSVAAGAAAAAAASDVDGETDDLLPDSRFPAAPIDGLEASNADVDAVAEADVYIAYGRYQQAEDLLKEAMSREPESLSLKNKLLEVYYATTNKDKFNLIAGEMAQAGQDKEDPREWGRICDMGRELDGQNPLYRGAAPMPSPMSLDSDVDAEGGDSAPPEHQEVDLVDSTLNDIEAEEKLLADTVDEPLLDIDDLEEIDNLEDLGDESLSLDELESLELDIPERPEAPPSGRKSEDDGIELSGLSEDSLQSLELPELDGEGGLLTEQADLEKESLGFELDALSGLSSLEDESLDRQSDENAGAADAGVAEEGLDAPISLEDAFGKDLDSDVEVLDIEGIEADAEDAEAVGTKLELARAFVEMGDGEGAREILGEVVKEGTHEQREQAEKLMADIA